MINENHPAHPLYSADQLRSHFPNGCDLELGPNAEYEIFEHPLYGDEALPLAVRYSEKLGREIVFDVFISGDDVCDLEECLESFLMAEDHIMRGAAE